MEAQSEHAQSWLVADNSCNAVVLELKSSVIRSPSGPATFLGLWLHAALLHEAVYLTAKDAQEVGKALIEWAEMRRK